MQVELIINPNAGNKPQERAIHLTETHFPDLKISKTQKQGDATRLAKESKADIIIAAGGDGTINEVIQGIIKKKNKPKLGILPLGTGNMFARYLKIPRDTDEALRCIKEQHTRKVDIGQINDKCFINAAGVGLDAATFSNVQPELKKLFGQISYHISGLQTLFTYEQNELQVKTKDLQFKGYYVIICNIGQYGPLHIAPQAKVDDGKLDILIFENKEIQDSFRYLTGVLTKGHTLQKDVKHIQTSSLEISAKKKTLYHADAEQGGFTPAKIKVLPKAVEVICPHITDPRKYIKKKVSSMEKALDSIKEKSAKELKRIHSKIKKR